MAKKRSKIAILFFLSLLFVVLPIAQAHAYGTGISSVDQFRNNSIDVYQLITFNYTIVGTESSAIAVIRNDGQLAENVQANAVDTLGSNNRIELVPNVKSVWSQTPYEIMQTSFGNYTEASYLMQRTFLNATSAYFNVTDLVNNETGRNTVVQSGYKFQATLLPAEDVAYDWCRKHNAILNSVDNVNLSVISNSDIVDFLCIQTSEEMDVDTNLDNGYQAVPVSAGEILTTAVVSLIIKLVLIILAATVLIVWACVGYVPFDFSSQVITYYQPDQSYNVNWTAPNLNESQMWQAYLDHCDDISETPTIEGYTEFVKNFYEATKPPTGGATWNNNFTNEGGDPPGNVLTNIIAFLKNLLPLIIAIIIVVAFVFGFVLIIRVIRSVSNYIPSPKPNKTYRMKRIYN